MQVEIWSDVICPWCYIGKRRFEQALAQFEHRDDVEVIWRSFELDPEAAPERMESLEQHLSSKYGVSLQQAAAMNARVTEMARDCGLVYDLSIARPGNTFDAHRLLHYANSRQLGEHATERVMQAYFCEGLPIGERGALARLAPEFGIAEHEARDVLDSGGFAREVRADETRAAAFGIQGVPCFVFDASFGISGAQPVDTFLRALNQAAGI